MDLGDRVGRGTPLQCERPGTDLPQETEDRRDSCVYIGQCNAQEGSSGDSGRNKLGQTFASACHELACSFGLIPPRMSYSYDFTIPGSESRPTCGHPMFRHLSRAKKSVGRGHHQATRRRSNCRCSGHLLFELHMSFNTRATRAPVFFGGIGSNVTNLHKLFQPKDGSLPSFIPRSSCPSVTSNVVSLLQSPCGWPGLSR